MFCLCLSQLHVFSVNALELKYKIRLLSVVYMVI